MSKSTKSAKKRVRSIIVNAFSSCQRIDNELTNDVADCPNPFVNSFNVR